MTTREQAKIILDKLDRVILINWNFKQVYLSEIEKGLKDIREKERRADHDENGTAEAGK